MLRPELGLGSSSQARIGGQLSSDATCSQSAGPAKQELPACLLAIYKALSLFLSSFVLFFLIMKYFKHGFINRLSDSGTLRITHVTVSIFYVSVLPPNPGPWGRDWDFIVNPCTTKTNPHSLSALPCRL